MKTKERTENILAGLELAVAEVIKPENLNRWISVRQRSITGILKDCGVDYNFSSAFLEELRNVGLVETSSSGCGMKYKVNTLQIPDIGLLARKIYENHKERARRDRVNDGYQTSRPSDLRPKSNKPSRASLEIEMKRNSSPVRVIPAEIAKLGDVGFIVRDNALYECMVIGVAYDTRDRKHIVYTVETYRGVNSEGESVYNVVSQVARREFFNDVASAVAAIQIFKYKRR